jgi:hypothetical protein
MEKVDGMIEYKTVGGVNVMMEEGKEASAWEKQIECRSSGSWVQQYQMVLQKRKEDKKEVDGNS